MHLVLQARDAKDNGLLLFESMYRERLSSLILSPSDFQAFRICFAARSPRIGKMRAGVVDALVKYLSLMVVLILGMAPN